MDLGLSLSAFYGFTLEEALETYGRLADRFGLTAFEINLQVRPGPVRKWPWDVPEERVRSFAERFPIRGAHLPFLDLNPIATNTGIREESRSQIQEAIELSARMEMTYVVTHASGSCNGGDWSVERSLWIDVFAEMVERAAGHGMTFCIENGECLVRLDRLLDVVETIDGDGARICVDVGHAHQRLWDHRRVASRLLPRLDQWWSRSFGLSRLMPYEAYGSLAGFLREAEPRIHHFHLHDRKGKTDHLGIGRGSVDLDSLASFLRRRPVILEIPGSSEAELAREIELAENLLERGGGQG